MKAQAASNMKAQASSLKRGTRPQAHTWVRQIVTCDNIVLDRQIVAWAVARGRRAQGHRLRQKKAQVRHIANLILNLKMRSSNYVKFNKWRKYGITIRLHSLGHRKMDRGATRLSCKFCMADDVHRHARYNEGECGRNYFSFRISSENWFWSIYQKNSSSRIKGSSTGLDWLQNQRQAGAAFQVYPKMDENCRARAARILGSEIVSTSNPGREIAWGFFVTIIINNRTRLKHQA
jgi:hypothetical protein